MTTENVQSNIVEVVGGHSAGGLTASPSTVVEVVGGEKVGLAAPAVVPSVTVDVVGGHQVGSLIKVTSNSVEVLGGQQIGRDIMPEVYSVVVEYVLRDASYKFQNATMEVVVSDPGAPTSIQQQARTLRQVAAVRRITAPLPVKSMEIISQVRQIIAQRAVRVPYIGGGPTYTLREVVAQRSTKPAPRSYTQARTVRQIVAKSRLRGPLPVSPLAYTTLRQIVAPRRATQAPATIRSPMFFHTDVQIVALSRRTRLIVTPADAYTMVEIVAQRRAAPAPHSVTTTWTNQQIVAQRRDTVMPISATSVYQFRQVAAQQRSVPAYQWSLTSVLALQQIAATRRDRVPPAQYRSPEIVGQYVQLAAQQRSVPAYQWSDLIFYTDVQLVSQRPTCTGRRCARSRPCTARSASSVRRARNVPRPYDQWWRSAACRRRSLATFR